MTHSPSIGDKVLISVGDNRELAFTILKFDGSLALLELSEEGHNMNRSEKICYRLNGKEKTVSKSQPIISPIRKAL